MELDYYSHLANNDKIHYDIRKEVSTMMSFNYGARRMLVELVKLREANPNYIKYETYRDHTIKLRKMLEDGWY